MPSIEFRIPLSPTDGFFAQVRFFDAALRRLGGHYRDDLLTLVVGDNCDLDEVRRKNPWSRKGNVRWLPVPREVFDRYGIHGTANYRFVPPTEADLLVLSDADTVVVRSIDPLLEKVVTPEPVIAGHMAHIPPPGQSVGDFPSSMDERYWPRMFEAFGVPWPSELYRYSMDVEGKFPRAPGYFNLGFVGLNESAREIFAREIFDFEDRIKEHVLSFMRCQIACSVIAYRNRMRVEVLGAEYNAANDRVHYEHNRLTPESLRVIHFLRTEEIDRSKIFLPDELGKFLDAGLANPVNREVQRVARELEWKLRAPLSRELLQFAKGATRRLISRLGART